MLDSILDDIMREILIQGKTFRKLREYQKETRQDELSKIKKTR